MGFNHLKINRIEKRISFRCNKTSLALHGQIVAIHLFSILKLSTILESNMSLKNYEHFFEKFEPILSSWEKFRQVWKLLDKFEQVSKSLDNSQLYCYENTNFLFIILQVSLVFMRVI